MWQPDVSRAYMKLAVLAGVLAAAAPPTDRPQRAASLRSKSIVPGRRCRRNGSSAIPRASRSTRATTSGCCIAPARSRGNDAAMAAPPVMVFDPAGSFVKAWGGAAAGYEWPEREHGIHVDDKGFVWITGNNCPTNGLPGLKPVADDQILKFTQDGKFVMQIGRSNQSTGNADTRNVHRAADVWAFPRTGELFVADGYGNHRVAVFDENTGAFKRMWGAFGNKPTDDDHCDVVAPQSVPDGPGPQNFSTVHAIRVAKDGTVYVADRENRRVQAFTNGGMFLKQLVKADTPFARDLALSADPAQQFLYVGNGEDIVVVDRSRLEVVGADQSSRHDRRRPSHRRRFEGQYLRRADGGRPPEARIQGDAAVVTARVRCASRFRPEPHRPSKAPSRYTGCRRVPAARRGSARPAQPGALPAAPPAAAWDC